MKKPEMLDGHEYMPEVKWMLYYTQYLGDNNIWSSNREEMNRAVLREFYVAVEWLLSQGYDEYKELVSRTVNPAQQNAFLALREYRVRRNGHYKHVSIYHRFFGGCAIEIRAL
jgi:hypothetical protein